MHYLDATGLQPKTAQLAIDESDYDSGAAHELMAMLRWSSWAAITDHLSGFVGW